MHSGDEMKQLQQDFRDGELSVEEIPPPAVRSDGVLVRTEHSAVSPGTERETVELARKSILGKAKERPDLVKQVVDTVRKNGLLPTYRAVTARLDSPISLGYSTAGTVVEVGENVSEFVAGDVVACAGQDYASHAELNYVPANLCTKVPDGVSTEEAAFTTLGAIAMQGIRRADLSPGERVGVVGLGLVGQLTAQLLDAYAFPILGTDIDSDRVDETRGLTARATIGEDEVEKMARQFSDGHGLDAVIVTAATESDQPVELAGALCRERGRVSVVGKVGMDVPRESYFQKELDLRVSRSYGPGRYDTKYEEKGLDYPISHVRWTENRNMQEFLRLVETGRVDTDSLVTHTFDIDEATDAYDLVLDGGDYLGIILEYPPVESTSETVGTEVTTEGVEEASDKSEKGIESTESSQSADTNESAEASDT